MGDGRAADFAALLDRARRLTFSVSNGVHPLHATGTTGYNDTAVTVSSYDPLAAGPNKVGGVCTSSSYSSTADWACQWTLTQANYYLAIDRSTSISDATNPLWW